LSQKSGGEVAPNSDSRFEGETEDWPWVHRRHDHILHTHTPKDNSKTDRRHRELCAKKTGSLSHQSNSVRNNFSTI